LRVTCDPLALPPRLTPGDFPPGHLRGWTARAAGTTSVRPPFAQTQRRRCGNLNPLSIAYALRPRLRPDSPRVDQPCSGTLGHSVRGILTRVALLIPAFSLATAPPLAHAAASPLMAMLPYRTRPTEVDPAPVASVPCLSPLGLSAPRHIRPVSYYALIQGWLLLSQPPGCHRVATTFPT
jgi:hypothetical protein